MIFYAGCHPLICAFGFTEISLFQIVSKCDYNWILSVAGDYEVQTRKTKKAKWKILEINVSVWVVSGNNNSGRSADKLVAYTKSWKTTSRSNPNWKALR